ncbi:hypothetical protein [Microbacterium gilvum]|uniref:hypothetical protein n=1 Tax=Microbacterium gilvum TaxID=1336204 RepID=UPI0031E73DCF
MQLYESVHALADDSVVVAVVHVVSQESANETGEDKTAEFTLSAVVIDEVVKSDGPAAGPEIIVRQDGGTEQAPPAELVEVGDTHLLYLTASELEGDVASQYYVTGANTGIYAASQDTAGCGTSQVFEQVVAETGQDLPAQISPEEATAPS